MNAMRPVALLSLALVACGEDPSGSLEESDLVALRAGIDDLDAAARTDLPATDEELEQLGTDFVVDAIDLSSCEREGIVTGIWADENVAPVFQGSWFKIGTRQAGGTIDGTYDEGTYEGLAIGDNGQAVVTGAYDEGVFIGRWRSESTSGRTDSGELIGHYERRNEHGGYFFGVWGHCE